MFTYHEDTPISSCGQSICICCWFGFRENNSYIFALVLVSFLSSFIIPFGVWPRERTVCHYAENIHAFSSAINC